MAKIESGQRQVAIRGSRGSSAARAGSIAGPGMVRPQSLGGVPSVQISAGAGLRAMAGAFQSLAQTAGQVMQSEFRLRAKQVEKEQSLLGDEEGRRPGVDLDQLQLPAGDSIGDEAFRRSAILASSAKVDTLVYGDTDELKERYAGRPEEFRKALEARASARIAKLDPFLQPSVSETYSRIGLAAYKELDEDRRVFERDQNRADILGAYKTYRDKAASLALRGDWATAREELDKLANITARAGPVELGGSGAFSLQEIESNSQDSLELIGGQFLRGFVSRTGDPRAALAYVQAGTTGNEQMDAMLAPVDEALAIAGAGSINRTVSELEQEIGRREVEARRIQAELRAEQRERVADLRDQARFAIDVLGDGLPVEGLSDLRQRIADEGAEGSKLLDVLDRAVSTASYGQQFALLPPDEQRAEIDRLKEQGQNPDSFAKLGRAQKILTEGMQERLPELRNETQFAMEQLAAGRQVEGLDDLKARIAAEGEAAAPLSQALSVVEEADQFTDVFGQAPVEAQAEAVGIMQGAPQTPSSAAKLDAATKVLRANVEAIKEGRVLQRASQLGIIELQPVDLQNADSIAARVTAARRASDHFGSSVELFTPDERASVAGALASMPGEEKAAYLAQMQAAAGDAYPDVIRDLSLKGGLDRASRYLSLLAGRPEAARVANAVGEAMDTDEKDLKVNLLKTNWSDGDVDRAVDKELRRWIDTLGPTFAQGSAGANEMISDVFDMVKRTALVQMRTMGPAEAVKSAADSIINSRYEFRDGYRILKPSVGGDTAVARFDQMMADTMASLQPEWLDVPRSIKGVDAATRQQGYYEAVMNRGRWANLPDESGLFLMDELGNAVKARGKPVIVKFGGRDDLAGGAGNDRLEGVVNSTGGGINPQAAVLVQRFLGRMGSTAYNPEVTAEMARALGIPSAPERQPQPVETE